MGTNDIFLNPPSRDEVTNRAERDEALREAEKAKLALREAALRTLISAALICKEAGIKLPEATQTLKNYLEST